MRVGGCQERFAIVGGDCSSPAIQVEPALVKMTNLDRIETVDFLDQSFPERGAKNEKRMRREAEKRSAAPSAQLTEVGESTQSGDFVRLNIQQHDIRPFQTHLRGGNEQDAHLCGIGKDFRAIKDLVMQGNRQYAKTECARPFQ